MIIDDQYFHVDGNDAKATVTATAKSPATDLAYPDNSGDGNAHCTAWRPTIVQLHG
jgi:hypothetical protein